MPCAETDRDLSLLISGLCVVLFALYSSAYAQQPGKIPRVGYLTAARLTAIENRTEAFRQGLRDLGYIEGKNIFIEWRAGEGNSKRFRLLRPTLCVCR